MESALKHILCFLCVMMLLPALCTSQYTFTSSRATYYGSPDCYGTPTGACGFGESGRTINDGLVSGVARLYRNGTGCGACYQVRCTYPQHCSDDGVKVVVTDHGEGDRTDFIFSPRAYAKLANNNPAATEKLIAYGVVDIEFRRIPCRYSGYNIGVKIHEHSHPGYLAIAILYVPGIADVKAVEYWHEDSEEWRGMRSAYGAVWDTTTPPSGDISLRLHLLRGSGGLQWVQANKVIASDWKAGAIYQSELN